MEHDSPIYTSPVWSFLAAVAVEDVHLSPLSNGEPPAAREPGVWVAPASCSAGRRGNLRPAGRAEPQRGHRPGAGSREDEPSLARNTMPACSRQPPRPAASPAKVIRSALTSVRLRMNNT